MVAAAGTKTLRKRAAKSTAWVVMRIQVNLSRGAVLGASLLALLSVRAAAQTSDAQTSPVQTTSVPARITQAVDDTNLAMLHGNVHRLARPEFDRGAIADAQPANRMVLLLQRSPEQETALRQLLDQQQSKDSKNYHAWLTPDQFAKQFAPADQDIQAVTSWLQGQGFQIGHVAAGGMFIEFTGTVGQVRSAFHTDIHRFVVNGEEHFANVSDPQIPAALTPVVAGIVSLHNFPRKSHAHKAGVFQRSKDTGEVRPLFTGGSGANQFFALGPADFAKIYNVPAALDGTGQTIAIVNDSNITMSDVTAFRTFFGLPPNNPTVILNGPDPGIQSGATGDESEADLDVEWSGAIAPKATIDLVISEGPTTVGAASIDLSALYIVENNLAAVMSESFGDCELTSTGSNQFYAALFEQAAAQGITALVSTGDSGSAACDGGSGSTATAAASGLAVSGIAATAFNIAVGGTDFDDAANPTLYWNTTNTPGTQESAKSYIPETTWNDGCASAAKVGSLATCATVSSTGIDLVGGSGGPSSVTAKPPWQTGQPSALQSDGKRDLPDVSLFASDGTKSHNFYVVCEADAVTTPANSCATSGTAEFLAVGGTSASTPAFAAIIALINQQTGQRQGNANYVLYKLAAQAGNSCDSSAAGTITNTSCIFYDTTKGNNSVACKGGTKNCSNATAGQFGVLVDPSATTTPAWTTTTGYDRATGLGSVNVANLAAKWTSVTFTPSTTTITSPASGATFAHSTNATFTVTVTGAGTPTGDVSLIASPAGAAQVAIGPLTLSGGTATMTTDLLPGGASYNVVAHYAGDGTFGASDSAPVTVTVTPETSKTAIAMVTFNSNGSIANSNATSAAYGSPYVLRVDVTNSAGTQCSTSSTVIPCPTGKVTITDNGTPLNDFSGSNIAVLNNLGFLEDQPVQLSAGTQALMAVYAGDNSYTGSTSATDAVTITQATTATTVTASPASVATGGSVTLTATVSTNSNGAGPTGTVQFKNGSTALGSAATCTPTAGTASTEAFCKATLMNTFSTAGVQSVTAVYSGDTNYTTSSSAAITVNVGGSTQATTTVVTSSATSIASGGSVTLTAKVTGTANNGAGVTGTVQFMNGSTALGSAATCTPTAGTSSTPGSCTATLMTTLSFLTPPPAPRQIPGLPVGLMWIAAGALLTIFLLTLKRMPLAQRRGYTYAGLLLFACLAAGIAGCSGMKSSSGSGSHSDSITGVYSGDANYTTSTSTAITITIQ
jgi:hypothetical protein